MRKILYGVLLAGLLLLAIVPPAAATDVTVTATPSYVSFSSTSTQWDMDDITDGDGLVDTDTIYYANPGGDTTAPSSTVVDGECLWNWTNDSSVNIDVFVNCSAFTGGDATMTPSSDGNNGVDLCGCYSYVSGNAYPGDNEIMKTSGSAAVYTTSSPGEDKYWGAQIETRTNAWTGSGQSTATISITASEAA